jgi:hypothetical protein
MDEQDKAWLKDWGPKVGACAYLVLVLAFLGSHEVPGSPAAMWFALQMAILPAVAITAVVLAFMWQKRKKG